MQALETNTRISLNNVLVTTDFSKISKTARSYATALAGQYGGENSGGARPQP